MQKGALLLFAFYSILPWLPTYTPPPSPHIPLLPLPISVLHIQGGKSAWAGTIGQAFWRGGERHILGKDRRWSCRWG